jgi:hypothetical protein
VVLAADRLGDDVVKDAKVGEQRHGESSKVLSAGKDRCEPDWITTESLAGYRA